MGSKPPHNEEESHNGEGPISPEQLESRNTERSKTVIKAFGDVTIEVDGGTDVGALLGGKIEDLDSLVLKLIILGAVILLIVIVWRMGTVIRLLEMLMS
ncbi:hypothetical protein [Haloarcula sp. JP-L23]|uniref:hypothetical protein n=1 Tax=Haloarcula sp. JP-L23 TaxID=2716717 RepID=UPI00140EB76E|nr:hypothetical protein G9465_25205 [Haloarcula sp. JP-L23]